MRDKGVAGIVTVLLLASCSSGATDSSATTFTTPVPGPSAPATSAAAPRTTVAVPTTTLSLDDRTAAVCDAAGEHFAELDYLSGVLAYWEYQDGSGLAFPDAQTAVGAECPEILTEVLIQTGGYLPEADLHAALLVTITDCSAARVAVEIVNTNQVPVSFVMGAEFRRGSALAAVGVPARLSLHPAESLRREWSPTPDVDAVTACNTTVSAGQIMVGYLPDWASSADGTPATVPVPDTLAAAAPAVSPSTTLGSADDQAVSPSTTLGSADDQVVSDCEAYGMCFGEEGAPVEPLRSCDAQYGGHYAIDADGICSATTPDDSCGELGADVFQATGTWCPETTIIEFMLAAVTIYAPVVDGVFDADLREAILKYQTTRGLDADGLVGPDTWDTLTDEYLTVVRT